MKRLAVLALLLALVLPAIASAKDPVVFARATATAEVELTAPSGFSAWPAFRDALETADRVKLAGFFKGPGGQKLRRGAPGRNWRRIGYLMAGSTRRLASVIRRDDAYTGGAHPMATVSGVIWDQRTKRRLPLGALFRADADTAALDRGLCDAVKAAKARLKGAARIDGRTWRCPLWSQASAALAPSTVPHRAGGLVVLINPYEVGPYAEGEYRVLVAYARFRRSLKPAYAPEFGGAPSAEALVLLAGPKLPAVKPKVKAKPEPETPEESAPAQESAPPKTAVSEPSRPPEPPADHAPGEAPPPPPH